MYTNIHSDTEYYITTCLFTCMHTYMSDVHVALSTRAKTLSSACLPLIEAIHRALAPVNPFLTALLPGLTQNLT